MTPTIRSKSDAKVRELERKIFGKELERIDDFAQTALNALSVRTSVLEMMARLD